LSAQSRPVAKNSAVFAASALAAFEGTRRVRHVLLDELDAARWPYRNSQIETVSCSNREQKLGSFCESAIGIWLLLLFGH